MQAVSILEGPWRDPVEVLGGFADEPFALALLSDGGERGRWSYVARRPDAVLALTRDDPRDPAAALRDLLGPPLAVDPDGPPFQGGLAGLAAYELGARFETVALARSAGWPDLVVGRYAVLLAFDHRRRRMLAVGRGAAGPEAKDRAREALGWAAFGPSPAPPSGPLAERIEAASAAAYEAAVAEVVGRIATGEIFQANIARVWSGRLGEGASPYHLFARLAEPSPAPFAAYLRLDDRAVVSNSPERFVAVEAAAGGLRVETRPIKGTRPRGRDAGEDAALAAELTASVKDRAENLMIVDLMRNDLARVCPPGAVAAPELFRLESFANVHHLVSTVTGVLAEGRDAADLLAASFPPGSITGAPKVQAMTVIAGLEPPRGPYCGSMFWAGFDGAFDSSVLIRTAALVRDGAGWRVELRAGAGIVADSDPVAERMETEAKIAALLGALTDRRA